MKVSRKNNPTNKVINIPVECLLNNYIDNDFETAYAPLNFTDRLFLIPKFNITNSFITPNNRITNLLAVFGAVLQVLISVFRFCYLLPATFNASGTFSVALVISETTYVIASILMYAISIVQSKNSVLMMIHLQQALQVIDFDKKCILSNHRFWNLVNIISIYTAYAIYTAVDVIGNVILGKSVGCTLLIVSEMFFNISAIYFTRTIDLIGRVLAAWNHKIVTNYQSKRKTNGHEEVNDNMTSVEELYSTHTKLIAAFGLCKNIFQFTILFHVFQTFILMLITVEVIIEFGFIVNISTMVGRIMLIRRIASLAWNVKNVVLLVNLSTASKKFYEHVRTAEATCMQVLNSTPDQEVRRMCKNVLRHNRASFRKLSACGVFAVDAALPLRVLAVVLTYTVVLLQFAFLSN